MSKFQVKKYLSPKRQSERHALLAIAKALVRASTESAAAGDDILYHLPGVFSLRITYKGESVRLIKEANRFRMMKSSEKSDVLLSMEIYDAAALGDVSSHKATWQKVYSEGRIGFAGKIKYVTLVMRVAAEGDKVCLNTKEYQNLYGE